MLQRICSARLLVFAALLLFPGCSGGEKLPTVPVVGTVTYNGAPLEGANVTFLPKSAEAGGRGASATTDAQGQFKLQTFFGGAKTVAGALPGDYQVGIAKRENLTEKFRATMVGEGPHDTTKLGEESAPPPSSSQGGPPGGSGPPGGGGGGPPGGGGEGGPPPGNPIGMAGKSLIPEKYEVPQTSGLTATVKPSGNEPLKFELAD